MTTKTVDCGAADTQVRERKCIPCEIGVFCRNHFYRGKLLTERDFLDEQKYSGDKARLHNLALHGWGVVCGLSVEPHHRCPELRFLVSAGLAIDCCGREIRVPKQVEIALPQPPPPKTETPCPDDTPPPRAMHAPETPPEQKQPPPGMAEVQVNPTPQKMGGGDDDEDHPAPYNPCDDTPEPADLYVCIRYLECETEFSPAPFDDCNCNSNGEQPNRICEGFKVEFHDTKPDWWDKAIEFDCGCENCGRFFEEGLCECQTPCSFPCLPLAVIRNFVPGRAVGKHQIDRSVRRQLVTTATLDRAVRCLIGKLPTQELTRIIDINWEHGERFLCHTFLNDYVGSEKHPKGFEIRFDSKVYSRSIDTRSFQALVIYRPDNLAEPRHMEMAPVHIETEEQETTEWCRLRIDPNYARKYLDGRNFDLFLTLKCNVITGKHGLAVDGNFLATREHDDVYRMAFPSGDNIPGGTFESWVRVRPRPK